MRMQASLEVLIITGAIAILILAATTQYGRVLGQEKSIPRMSYGNFTSPQNPVYYQMPYAVISIPAYSSAAGNNYASIAAYGCSNGTISVAINSTDMVFSSASFSSDFFNAGIWEDAYAPSPGLDVAAASYSILCGARRYSGAYDLNTMYGQSSSNQSQYSAYISGRNESVRYKLKSSEVQSLSSSSHCTYQSWTYYTFPILYQCGTNDAWEYMVSSGACASNGGPFTETICIAPGPSGYNLSSISQTASYSYSMNLTIYLGEAFMSRISSSNSVSPITLMGREVGNATVESVSSQQLPPSGAILSGAKSGYVNSTDLSGYENSLVNLDSVLGYYNSSWVSSDIASEIQQTVSSYGNYEGRLLSSPGNATQYDCIQHAGMLQCNASYPFLYVINAYISPKYFSGNKTVYFEGSMIRVHN